MEDSDSKALKFIQQNDIERQWIDELSSMACEMVRLIETATIPIFGVDLANLINGWNVKIAEMTGLQASDAIGKSYSDLRHRFSQIIGSQSF
nr:phytochrome b [Quercus suber]